MVLSGVIYKPLSYFPWVSNDYLEISLLASSLPLSTRNALCSLHDLLVSFLKQSVMLKMTPVWSSETSANIWVTTWTYIPDVLGTTNRLIPFDLSWTKTKRGIHFFATWTSLPSCYLTMTGDVQRDAYNNPSIVECFLYRGEVYNEMLPCIKERNTLFKFFNYFRWEGYTHRPTVWWQGFRKYAAEMGTGAMIQKPNFTKPG
jgi:hypothetical protein